MIELKVKPEIAWQMDGQPDKVWEIHKLGNRGRIDGEKIGWVCERLTCYEWRSTPGVAIQHGVADNVAEAVRDLMYAMDGGAHVRQYLGQTPEPIEIELDELR